jgi:hypothetical protein
MRFSMQPLLKAAAQDLHLFVGQYGRPTAETD